MIRVDGLNFSFERAFYRLAPTMNSKIIKVCEQIILDAMKVEIAATVKVMNKNSFSENELDSIISLIDNDKDVELKTKMNTIPLTISYDMR